LIRSQIAPLNDTGGRIRLQSNRRPGSGERAEPAGPTNSAAPWAIGSKRGARLGVLGFIVLLGDAPLTLREFMTDEPVPLASIFREVMSLLATRDDAVVFGAHAVNAYCEPERMTADIDVLSTNAAGLADDVRAVISDRFRIAVRVREVVPGGFRVYQLRKPKNRHLVDVRQVQQLPEFREIGGIRVVEPAELAAMKSISIAARRGQEKGLSDRLDLHRLLRAFPDLRSETGPVPVRLLAIGADFAALAAWREVVQAPLEVGDDEGDE
jgi:hypothetical protein